jgi:hypothetical protein
MSNTLGVTGAVTLSNTLGVTGLSTLGSANVTVDLRVGTTTVLVGAATLSNTATVAGLLTATSGVNAIAASQFGNTVSVANVLTVSSRAGFTGNVGIGPGMTIAATQTLYVNGAIFATGDITGFSSEEGKEDVVVIDTAMDRIQRMRGVFFTRKADSMRRTGMIAEEVRRVMPEAIVEAGDSIGIAYASMVGLIVEGMKELRAEIRALAG